MTSPDHVPLAIRRILVPIDGSPSERATMDYAVLVAAALHASITLVHVNEIPNSMLGILPGVTIEDDLAAERAIWMERLDHAAAELARRGISGTQTLCVVSPDVASALVDLARRESFDLIIMATRARTGVSRAVLGSVAEQVLRHAPCPVLTVHHPDLGASVERTA